jgi:hypothetical protein
MYAVDELIPEILVTPETPKNQNKNLKNAVTQTKPFNYGFPYIYGNLRISKTNNKNFNIYITA